MFNYIPSLSYTNLIKIIIILLIIIVFSEKMKYSILLFFIKTLLGRFIFSIILCVSSYYNTSVSVLLTILFISMSKKIN
jgi:hypothetical protein